MVDLHCHLLPDVDDGPDTMEQTVAYARTAFLAGTTTIVATPHVELVDVMSLPERVHEVRAALAEQGIGLKVEVGGELKPGSIGRLSDEELDVIAHGPDGARWLLYEVPFRGVEDEFLEGARELRARGYGVLLAHPERSRGFLAEGLARLDPLVRSGAVFEVNVGPLSGREGPERFTAARHLQGQGSIGVVATDAHPPRRPWLLADLRGVLEGSHERLASSEPARLLREGIPAP